MDNNTNFKLSLGGVEEAVNQYKERIEPGVHECVILGVVLGELENEKKSKYIGVKVATTEMTREHEERFFIGEVALPYSLQRIKHLVKAVAGPEVAEKELSVQDLDKILSGKQVRIKFIGEEYEYTSEKGTEIRVRTSFAFRGFAENIDVPEYATGLKYNPNSNWDFKRLQKEIVAPQPTEINANIKF